MEYVREITGSSNLMPLFNSPKAMHNKRIEVITFDKKLSKLL